MKKCIECKEYPTAPIELTYNDGYCNPCYINKIDNDAFSRGLQMAKKDYQRAYQNLKHDLKEKIERMALTELGRADILAFLSPKQKP